MQLPTSLNKHHTKSLFSRSKENCGVGAIIGDYGSCVVLMKQKELLF